MEIFVKDLRKARRQGTFRILCLGDRAYSFSSATADASRSRSTLNSFAIFRANLGDMKI